MTISIDVRDLLTDTLPTEGGIVVERRVEPSLDDAGEAVAAGVDLIPLADVAVHTASERDLLRLPEADRVRESIRVYTIDRLRTSGDGYTADVVRYRGARFEVVEVADYALQGGVWIATAQKTEAET